MLVHICCSVDSHFFLEQLKESYPDENFVGFFYDPNIHPYSEYLLRLKDTEYSCNLLNIPLIEGPYDVQSWLNKVRGLENEPEKGDRCTVCFDDRLEISALKAKELGHLAFTTSLLVSPKKSQEKLQIIGDKLATKYHLNFIFQDYRINNGAKIQSDSVKNNRLYRQDYCGCMFALDAQRQSQEKLTDELCSPINQQILPNSIEYRLALFETRTPQSTLIKESLLNYRLLMGWVKLASATIPSYILPYSILKRKTSKCKIETNLQNICYANRDNMIFIDIHTFNRLANSHFSSVTELYFHPPTFEVELQVRNKIVSSFYNTSPIIVLDSLQESENYEVFIDALIYEDSIQKVIN